MATRPQKPAARPGFEPAKGFPDPQARPAPPVTGTHFPNRDRAVCGFKTSDPNAYDTVAPTCPTCASWLAAATRNTQGILARQKAGDPPPAPPAPAAAEPETETEPA